MDFLSQIQFKLEDRYGILLNLDVRDFVRETENLSNHGELIVEQNPDEEDLNIALLLDRDILTAWSETQTPRDIKNISVPLEEVSHFVYLSFNHIRGRNITRMEMEIQSEIDRVMLAYHGGLNIPADHQESLLDSLLRKPYPDSKYEECRRVAASFIRVVGDDPRAWTPKEFTRLRKFFHSDLSEKIFQSK